MSAMGRTTTFAPGQKSDIRPRSRKPTSRSAAIDGKRKSAAKSKVDAQVWTPSGLHLGLKVGFGQLAFRFIQVSFPPKDGGKITFVHWYETAPLSLGGHWLVAFDVVAMTY